MKVVAIAHPMQALVKYHGLKDWELRIPYHDSISVNMSALSTRTKVELVGSEKDEVMLNGELLRGRGLERVINVIEHVRKLAGKEDKVKIESENSLSYSGAKGLGFSSSGGAALAAALFKACGLDWDLRKISIIARRFSGSACRSVVGGYAQWYAGHDDESSYAERIAGGKDLDLGIVIVPLSSEVRTEEAHREVETSPFFNARVKSASKRCTEMRDAILEGDLLRVAQLAEIDSLELHALTMTGEKGLVAYKPESILIMSEIRRMRQNGLNAYFSMQTGPSIFINTYPEEVKEIRKWVEELGLKAIESRVGGEVKLV
jgi:diphosphomevalonate decarboxylase